MSWSGQEAHPDVREWSGGPPGCPGVFERPSRMPGSCREALPYSVVVGRASLMCERPSRMPCSGQEALPDVRRPPRCPGVVGRTYQMYESGREALPNVREWSGCPPRCPGVVGMPSQMSGSGREALPVIRLRSGGPTVSGSCWEALPNVLEWSRGPPRCQGVVRRPSRMSGSVRETLPYAW